VPPAGGRDALDPAAVALGVGLLFAAVLLASFRSRDQEDLDWSNFLLGIAATLGLLGIATVGQFLLPRSRTADLVAWPGAFGAVAAGLMLGVGIDKDWAAYPSGLLVVALSVLGYLFVSRPAFVVTAVLGLFLVYLKLTDDAFDIADLDDLDDNLGLIVGLVLLVFVLAVTAAGWFLPTRVYSGVVAGTIAVVGYATVLLGLLVASAFVTAFDDASAPRRSGYEDDVWWIMAFSVVLAALWMWCSWVTGHAGFRLLVVAILATALVLGTSALAVEHPTWWELVVGLLGGGVLVLLFLRKLGRRIGPSTSRAVDEN
jgi:hypothetical protein